MYHIYILKCENQKIYVGLTNRFNDRMYEHIIKKSGSEFTAKNKPIELIKLYKLATDSVSDVAKWENEITWHWMQKYGPDNVFGGNPVFYKDHNVDPSLVDGDAFTEYRNQFIKVYLTSLYYMKESRMYKDAVNIPWRYKKNQTLFDLDTDDHYYQIMKGKKYKAYFFIELSKYDVIFPYFENYVLCNYAIDAILKNKNYHVDFINIYHYSTDNTPNGIKFLSKIIKQ